MLPTHGARIIAAMSNPEFEQRINNKIETILETQANLQEAIAGLIQVARMHDEQIDRNSEQIKELRESIKEQKETVDALVRIVEGHISNHP